MICPMCKGGRKVLKKEKGDMGYIVRLAICDKCNGTGEIKETNEEWFCTLSTEEKARFFDRICYSAWGDRTSRFRDMADYTDWVEWLKQDHDEVKE